MRKKLFIITIITLSTIMTSCGIYNKTTYISRFNKLIEKTENNPKMDDKKFNKYEFKYEEYSGKYYEKFRDKMTLEDKKEIGKLKARFLKVAVARGIKKFGNIIDDTIQQVGGFLEELDK